MIGAYGTYGWDWPWTEKGWDDLKTGTSFVWQTKVQGRPKEEVIKGMYYTHAKERGHTEEQIKAGQQLVIEKYRKAPGILGVDSLEVQLPDGTITQMTPAEIEAYQAQMDLLAREQAAQAKNGKNGKPPPEWLPALVISGGVILVAVSVAVALRGKK